MNNIQLSKRQMIYFHKLIVSIMINSILSFPYFSLYHQFLRVFKRIRFINQNFHTLITYYVFTYIYHISDILLRLLRYLLLMIL